MAVANTLAYHDMATIMTVNNYMPSLFSAVSVTKKKSFIIFPPISGKFDHQGLDGPEWISPPGQPDPDLHRR